MPPMRADWTASGACTSGSTAPPRGATRRACGGAATTSTTSAEPSRGCRWRNRGTGDLTTHGFRASFPASLLRRLGAALRRQRGGDDRLVRVHVGDGRDADARRLDDVDGLDADVGQTWPGAAAPFLGMWVVMMVAMMLPSLAPMLWRYRQAVGRTGETRLGRLTAL